MTKTIYQLKISLKHFKPTIWRRILVPSNTLLIDFHKIIQTTMGWSNCHLHQFVKNRELYSIPYDGFDDIDVIDYKKKKIRISDLLQNEKDRILYEYDFGDGWEHDIVLEKILPSDTKIKYPVCVKGKMNCPPEDCGGVWGYADMLEIIKQPNHEEYEDIIIWLGKDFDPEYFDIDETNEMLREKDYGCYDYF